MRVIEGENELRLTCSRSASGGIALLRCETQDDIVRLPDEIDGVPVTEVGAYVLSERAPDLTGKDTFAVRITCGGTEPKHNAAAIRTVTLPKDAKSVGSYAFYNCRNLERIELTDSVSEFGGGALMNCMSLREVILHAAPSAPTCLPRLLGEYAGELDVRFDEHARLLFPEYVEELEDLSPAHIFQRRIHGAGYSYRQCFDGGVLNFRQYDAALSELLERHDFSVAARVAVRRLAVPFVLSDAAKADYLTVLRTHGGNLAQSCAKAGETAALTFLLSLGVLSAADVDAACTSAREAEQTAALSVLLSAAGKTQSKGRAKSFEL
ncbi:MAG: leucine-rich repeat protein [Eubacteriales bacterium]